jgi:lipopolysaccharide biosynthesis glycosyltransferase
LQVLATGTYPQPKPKAPAMQPSKLGKAKRLHRLARPDGGPMPQIKTQEELAEFLAEIDSSFTLLLKYLAGIVDPAGEAGQRAARMVTKYSRRIKKPYFGVGIGYELMHDGTLDESVARTLRTMGIRDQKDLVYGLLRSAPEIATLARGLLASHDGQYATAWELLNSVPQLALANGVQEYLEAGLALKHTEVVEPVLEWLADPASSVDVPAMAEVIELLLVHRLRAEAKQAYDIVSQRLLDDGPTALDDKDRARIAAAHSWVHPQPQPATPGRVRFGVVNYGHPRRVNTSSNIGDYVQTIGSLMHLLRHERVQIETDNQPLRAVLRSLQADIKPEFRITGGQAAPVDVVVVNRDASHLDLIPEQTWMLAFGWYAHKAPSAEYQLPFNPNIRPIFVSFHIDYPDLLTADVIEYLKRYGPVGCRDWATVYLLLGAGVPAFFSGCITTTVGACVPEPTGDRSALPMAYVDTKPAAGYKMLRQVEEEIRDRPLAWGLRRARRMLADYTAAYGRIVTGRLHCYLPMSSIGIPVEYTDNHKSDRRLDGLRDLDVAGVRAMGARLSEFLVPAMDKILSGASEDEVYTAWQQATAGAVAEAKARFEAPLPVIEPPFDISSMVVGAAKSVPQPASNPDRIDLVVAFDAGFYRPALTSVFSMVANCSAPLTLHVLSRGIGKRRRELLQTLVGDTPVNWFNMESADYGDITGMLPHISVATMDRLLIPELLPDSKRAVYLDVDTLITGDIAELAAFDLGGNVVAARDSSLFSARSGLRTMTTVARAISDYQVHDEFFRVLSRIRGTDFSAFNAGVLVMDLDAARAQSLTAGTIGYVARYGPNDQQVLNLWCGDDHARLPMEWNYFADQEVLEVPKLTHFAGARKPWSMDMGKYTAWWRDWEERARQAAAGLGSAWEELR